MNSQLSIPNPFANFTFRCSSLGDIISKEGKITKGIEAKLLEIYYSVIKGYYKEISSKYMEKGKFCEQEGINLLQATYFHFLKFPIIKNTERKYNGWIEGEHDVKILDIIVDIKNCWDWITLRTADLSWTYEWQLRGYMMLNDCSEAILYYALLTPPEHMLVDMEKKMFYQRREWISMEDSGFMKACDELRMMYNFNLDPAYQRFKLFKITRDLEKEEQIKKSVEMCRNRLFQIHLEHLSEYKQNQSLMGIAA